MKSVLNISKFVVDISDNIKLNIGQTRVLQDFELNDAVNKKLEQLSSMNLIRVYDYVEKKEEKQEVTTTIVEGPDDIKEEPTEEKVVEEVEETPVEEKKTTKRKTTKK